MWEVIPVLPIRAPLISAPRSQKRHLRRWHPASRERDIALVLQPTPVSAAPKASRSSQASLKAASVVGEPFGADVGDAVALGIAAAAAAARR